MPSGTATALGCNVDWVAEPLRPFLRLFLAMATCYNSVRMVINVGVSNSRDYTAATTGMTL